MYRSSMVNVLVIVSVCSVQWQIQRFRDFSRVVRHSQKISYKIHKINTPLVRALDPPLLCSVDHWFIDCVMYQINHKYR